LSKFQLQIENVARRIYARANFEKKSHMAPCVECGNSLSEPGVLPGGWRLCAACRATRLGLRRFLCIYASTNGVDDFDALLAVADTHPIAELQRHADLAMDAVLERERKRRERLGLPPLP